MTRARWFVSAVVVAFALTTLSAQEDDVTFLWSKYWAPPTTQQTFPEACYLAQTKTANLGITFSGGGTRSASATIGELRGMLENGWLSKVRYIAAVSGGSWAATPFVYAPYSEATLLGPSHLPQALGRSLIETRPPEHTLARAVVDARTVAAGGVEAAKIIAAQTINDGTLPTQVKSLVNRLHGGIIDRTYANILARAFITPLIPDGEKLPYGWTPASVEADFGSLNDFSRTQFVTTSGTRPFLIVGGSIIYMHEAYTYPRLMPIEYTPLYTGVRNEFSGRLGGSYVWPFAYHADRADLADATTLRVRVKKNAPPFSLADMIASSGAAPLLTLFLNDPTGFSPRVFPTFNHYTVRNRTATPVTTSLLHGDGGFTDYLGLMPLLARQVTNIIVFLNGTGPITKEQAIESLFYKLNLQTGSADRKGNVVFDQAHYEELVKGLEANVQAGLTAAFCGRNWRVLDNELYGIRAYSGLNICFVNTERNDRWVKELPTETQELLTTRGFRGFPWFSTFLQNVPYVIRLKPAQVNLMSEFTTWMLTEPRNRRLFEDSSVGPALTSEPTEMSKEFPACPQPQRFDLTATRRVQR
ncbi:MAG TPA: hypothetical protein VKB50_09255 [Vicinamibacterales bacterium]|nr:hypothetical protein [Vicinamibacterales bacterium]